MPPRTRQRRDRRLLRLLLVAIFPIRRRIGRTRTHRLGFRGRYDDEDIALAPLLSEGVVIQEVSITVVVRDVVRHYPCIVPAGGIAVLADGRSTLQRRGGRPPDIPDPDQIVQTATFAHVVDGLIPLVCHLEERHASRGSTTAVHHLQDHVLGVLGMIPVPYAVRYILPDDGGTRAQQGRIVPVVSRVLRCLECG